MFKDTLNFFGTALANLPSTFGLEVADKPFFPHYYNRHRNLNTTRVSLPAEKFYDPSQMKPKQRNAFIEWYNDNRENPFKLRDQLYDYCKNDVVILREAVIKFRELVRETADTDPFVEASTLAKLALTIYRTHHLPRDTMVNAPEKGYRHRDMQSHIAKKYFHCYEKTHNVQLHTSQWSIGEYRVADTNYRIDAVIHHNDGRPPSALEFFGCYWHGCPTCYPNRESLLAGGRNAKDIYNASMERIAELESRFGPVEIKWECEFHAELNANSQLREIYESYNVPEPLNARKHCLRGGRVEPFKLHHECCRGEEIVYMDIVSLHPHTTSLTFHQ